MNPIKLEIFLDDKTLAGMRSVEGNVANMEAFTRRMIGHLKLELKDLEKEYKNLQKQGLAGEREMADIQALKGAIGGLKEQLKEYEAAKKRASETPVIGNDPHRTEQREDEHGADSPRASVTGHGTADVLPGNIQQHPDVYGRGGQCQKGVRETDGGRPEGDTGMEAGALVPFLVADFHGYRHHADCRIQ